MKRPTRQGVLFSALVTLMSLLLGLTIVSVLTLRSRVDRSEAKAEALRSALAQSDTAVGALARQVKSLGATPVVSPSAIPGPSGPGEPISH